MNRGRRNALRKMAWLLAALPVSGLSQPSARTGHKRVFVLLGPSTAPDPIGPTKKAWAGLFAQHGLVDGRDIEITIIRADPFADELGDALRAAVARRADVILGHASGFLAKTVYLPVTRGTPLVLFGVDDGSDDSIEALNHRGENVTGAMYSYHELVEMRFGLVKAMRPGTKRAAIVVEEMPLGKVKDDVLRHESPFMAAMEQRLGMEVALIELRPGAAPQVVIDTLRRARVDVAEIRCCASAALWAGLAKHGIAALVVGSERVKEGALLGGWTVGFIESAARLAARVLRGARAAEIPVERSMEFGLAINLRTAKAMGITVPASILLRANEVFD